MEIEVHGKNVPVTPPLREYAAKRFQRLQRLLAEARIDLELALEKNPRIAESQIAEVTVHLRGETLRARSTSTDMYAAIDLVSERLRRQAADYHDRHQQGRPHHAARPAADVAEPEDEEETEPAEEDWQPRRAAG